MQLNFHEIPLNHHDIPLNHNKIPQIHTNPLNESMNPSMFTEAPYIQRRHQQKPPHSRGRAALLGRCRCRGGPQQHENETMMFLLSLSLLQAKPASA